VAVAGAVIVVEGAVDGGEVVVVVVGWVEEVVVVGWV